MGVSSAFALTRRLGITASAVACLLPAASGVARAVDSEKSPNSPAPKSTETTPAKTATAQAVGQAQAWPIHFNYMKPTDFMKVIIDLDTHLMDPRQKASLLPSTVQSITPDDTRGTITVRGTDLDDLNKIREIVRLLDVRPRQVKLIVRFTHAPDADRPDSFVQPVLAVAVVQVKNNEPTDVSVFADHHLMQAHITPHINGDDTVSLAVSLTSQATGTPSHDTDTDISAATRRRGDTSAFADEKSTWYHSFAALAPSELRENGGKADPANVKTVSYAENVNNMGKLSLPPKGEYAASIVPVLVSADTPLQK